MGIVHPGPRNPNWKGGRTIASNGYVLIKLPGHHLADVRGYVYEHRLVAERKLGRPLEPGEEVHHVNHDKADNSPSNIEIYPSRAHHFVQHRRVGINRRMPGEENRVVQCACGCGRTFLLYDWTGRPRRYVSGHNHGKRRVTT